MIIVAKSAIEQLNILKSIPEKEKLTTIVLANPWVSTDYHCNKVIYDKNMQQIMNFVNCCLPDETKEYRVNVARRIFNDKAKELGWKPF